MSSNLKKKRQNKQKQQQQQKQKQFRFVIHIGQRILSVKYVNFHKFGMKLMKYPVTTL